ncbi:MFS general substrate transporter [Hyaloscypha variabilis F]|uniref:MFS general substrate transporter n=1 Tax=Hyaloscypha variabilis (strain UAMH 11265 / GT02V1 / F) TaxID=1149755 RepID=A0A2J6RCW9_HYAVF|nr:MFS general substrate transporter [Hyaloscypha variabilis F]
MQIPSTLIIQKVRPSYWLGLMEIAWGTFTFAQAGMHSVSELYAFRFLVANASCLYTAKRIALFHMTAPLGTAFSGYLQAAVYTNLNGVHGLAGWRWLYIICGVMTVPVGIATVLFLPDTPHTTRAWFLTADECALGLERVKKAGKAPPVPITWAKARRIFTRWRWYALVLGYILYGTSCAASGYFAIWLKSEHFSVALRNVIPSGASLISAACVILWGFGADYTGSRFAFVLGPLVGFPPEAWYIYGLIPNGILAVWPKSEKLKEYAFLTTGVQLMTAVFYTWANEICAGDSEERAIVLSSMNGLQYAVAAWLPIVIFPQTEAPTFRRGFPATFGFVVAALLAILLIQFLHTRELKQKKAAELRGGEAVDSEEGSSYGNKNKEEVDVVETGNFQELASAGAVIS